MRILMVSQMLPYLPCHDGFRVIPAHLLRCLSGRHELHLLACVDRQEENGHLQWAKSYCASVKLVRTGGSRTMSERLARFSSGVAPELVEETRKLMAAFRPEVVHFEGPAMAPLARCIPFTALRLLSAHDSLSLRYRQFASFASSWRKRASLRLQALRSSRFERRWYPELDRVVVTSPSDLDMLARWVPREKLLSIPNGIDLDQWAHRPNPYPGRIVFTGNMSWPPNEDAAEFFARQVYPIVRQQDSSSEFWIAGASPSERIRALTSIVGVKVTGTVPDLREYVWSAAVYVSPLRFGAGVKNKILEAMALGPPIVATPASLTGTPLEHGRHVLVAESAPEIAAAVLRLLADRDLTRSISAEARRHVEQNYSWDSIAAQFERAWQTLERNCRL